MQMYLWDVAPLTSQFINILSPADIAGPRDGRDNNFTPGHIDIPFAPNFIQSELILFDDGSPDVGAIDNADGCSPAINAAAMSGKIVVIRRSLAEAAGGAPCAFVEKVINAQNAGATAVIMVNNVTNPAVIVMGGGDANITIPAVSVTQEIGEALIARVKIETVVAKLQLTEPPFINADGSFDNGIIAHEYGHGISTRLTGGPANSSCLFNDEAMGEGWSDWFALMMLLKAGDVESTPKSIATFAISQPVTGSGIRTFPYSTDLAINPRTLSYSNSDSANYRYDVGEVWTSVLWDLTWAYINKYGFDANVFTGTGGNNKVMQLVLDGLKLQPCSPGFIAGRDAIIAADQATTGGQDYCMIWEVFARRGMGVNASSGSTASSVDQIEDFTEPAPGANCTLGVDYFENSDMIRVYPNPSNGQLTIRINGFSGKVLMQLIDVNGRIVHSVNDTDFNIEKTINLNHLQSGIYILKVNGDSINHTQKIILN